MNNPDILDTVQDYVESVAREGVFDPIDIQPETFQDYAQELASDLTIWHSDNIDTFVEYGEHYAMADEIREGGQFHGIDELLVRNAWWHHYEDITSALEIVCVNVREQMEEDQ